MEEAHGSQSKAGFTAKMYVACKEALETHYWHLLLAATDLLSPSKLESITDEADQLVSILTSIVEKSRSH